MKYILFLAILVASISCQPSRKQEEKPVAKQTQDTILAPSYKRMDEYKAFKVGDSIYSFADLILYHIIEFPGLNFDFYVITGWDHLPTMKFYYKKPMMFDIGRDLIPNHVFSEILDITDPISDMGGCYVNHQAWKAFSPVSDSGFRLEWLEGLVIIANRQKRIIALYTDVDVEDLPDVVEDIRPELNLTAKEDLQQ